MEQGYLKTPCNIMCPIPEPCNTEMERPQTQK